MNIKRLFDIVFSIIISILFLIPFLIIIFIYFFINEKNIFYISARPGLNGKCFNMIKFRTMKTDLTCNGVPLSESDRITKFGKFLRSTSLDELPQLLNVIRGDMSLVGPRPLLKEYLPYYTINERRRHSVRPGITGLSQISGRNLLDWKTRFEIDLYYVDNNNLLMDILILYKTVAKVISAKDVIIDPSAAMKNLNTLRSNDITIKPIGMDNLFILLDLFRASMTFNYLNHSILSSPKCLNYFNETSSEINKLIGIFRGEQLVGGMNYRVLDNNVHLNYFAISKSEHGWGTSDLLFSELLKISHDYKSLTLSVESSNIRAISYYLKNNFKITSQSSSIYIDIGVDGISIIPNNFNIDNYNFFKNYGFGYLRYKNTHHMIGYIYPNKVSLPNSISPEIFFEILNSLAFRYVCVGSNFIDYIPPSYAYDAINLINMKLSNYD